MSHKGWAMSHKGSAMSHKGSAMCRKGSAVLLHYFALPCPALLPYFTLPCLTIEVAAARRCFVDDSTVFRPSALLSYEMLCCDVVLMCFDLQSFRLELVFGWPC